MPLPFGKGIRGQKAKERESKRHRQTDFFLTVAPKSLISIVRGVGQDLMFERGLRQREPSTHQVEIVHAQ